jgi:Universal stress protein family
VTRITATFNESHTVPVEHIVDAGNAADLIDRYVRKYAVDLRVLGSPERELSEQDFQSSTVLQVISRVHCPVLCLAVQASAAATQPECGLVTAWRTDWLCRLARSFVAAALATDSARL